MEQLPILISIVFGLITISTLYIFYTAARRSKTVLWILLAWMGLQALISQSGFYLTTNTVPPRFLLAIGLPLVAVILLISTAGGRRFIDKLDRQFLTLLHIIRIPVELVLLFLFIYKTIPGIMTFEGRNFDILSGISAILIWYLMYVKKRYNKTVLLWWNILCLALLANIVTIAILAAPFNFQQLAFEQPNIAVLYFPFIWLPSLVVPLVLLAHLASIRQIIKEKKVPVNRLTIPMVQS